MKLFKHFLVHVVDYFLLFQGSNHNFFWEGDSFLFFFIEKMDDFELNFYWIFDWIYLEFCKILFSIFYFLVIWLV